MTFPDLKFIPPPKNFPLPLPSPLEFWQGSWTYVVLSASMWQTKTNTETPCSKIIVAKAWVSVVRGIVMSPWFWAFSRLKLASKDFFTSRTRRGKFAFACRRYDLETLLLGKRQSFLKKQLFHVACSTLIKATTKTKTHTWIYSY